MKPKVLYECDNIFLDSGIIIDLLKIDLTGCSQDVILRIEQTKKFMEAIEEYSATMKKKFTFQASTISIAEIFHLDNSHPDVTNAILSVINNQQFELFAFDLHIALDHNAHFGHLLGNKAIEILKAEVGYPTNMYANVRDRIRKDILIAATARLYNSDVVLTNDNGFKTLCEKLGIPCHCITGNPDDFLTDRGNNKILNWNQS